VWRCTGGTRLLIQGAETPAVRKLDQ